MSEASLNIEALPLADWYEDYYAIRVQRKVCADMEECARQGFFGWIAEHRPELYNRITAADDEINSLWLNRSDQESFKAACRSWYNLLMEGKDGFLTWKAKKRQDAVLAGRQEAMALR